MLSDTTGVHPQLISTHPLCSRANPEHRPRTLGEICCIFMRFLLVPATDSDTQLHQEIYYAAHKTWCGNAALHR